MSPEPERKTKTMYMKRETVIQKSQTRDFSPFIVQPFLKSSFMRVGRGLTSTFSELTSYLCP